jgi:transposase
MARPTKYTPETAKKIYDAIRVGATYELACAYAGISYETFNQWRKAKAQFSEAVKEAEGGAAIKWLAQIDKAAQDGTWQAAAWKLERRYPREYGRTVMEHAGSVEVVTKGYVTKDASPDAWDDSTDE